MNVQFVSGVGFVNLVQNAFVVAVTAYGAQFVVCFKCNLEQEYVSVLDFSAFNFLAVVVKLYIAAVGVNLDGGSAARTVCKALACDVYKLFVAPVCL